MEPFSPFHPSAFIFEISNISLSVTHFVNQKGGRKPWNSINFVCAHDGFTLADLVTYNNKHNTANGEDNKDGENQNNSWNCGQVNIDNLVHSQSHIAVVPSFSAKFPLIESATWFHSLRIFIQGVQHVGLK